MASTSPNDLSREEVELVLDMAWQNLHDTSRTNESYEEKEQAYRRLSDFLSEANLDDIQRQMYI